MLAILSTTGRVLLRHWPALLAWFLGGMLARYLIVELAGFVGGYSATVGMLILPLAVLARLVSFVAMFLLVRDALRNLEAVAPSPDDPRSRRQVFLSSLFASILPFFAVYAAWGHLREDFRDYGLRALSEASNASAAVVFRGGEVADREVATEVSFSLGTLVIIAVAFAGRWAWKRWAGRLPRVLSLLAVYLEVVWVFFAVALISEVLGTISGWVDSRVAVVWVQDLRAWLADQLAPVAWVWDAIEWLLGEAGGILFQPLAWLTVAGVIYGQAIVAERLRIEHRLLERAKARAERVPSAIRRRIGDLVDEATSRFRSIGRAVLLMWRAGPVMIAGFVLLYTAVLALAPLLEIGVAALVGPHDAQFWAWTGGLFALLPLLIVEPLRVALVAGAYDRSLLALRGGMPEATADQGSIENLTNVEPAENGATSTQNGPAASSGTMNGTSTS